jgi:hypothetical protein
MLFRAILSCTALIVVLLLCLNANAAPACNGAPCPVERPSKPLDIMKFMRAQAASTRAAERPRRAVVRPATAVVGPTRQAPKRRAIVATPSAIPSAAATSFAAQPTLIPQVEVVMEDELNAIDRAGEAAPPETVGAASGMQIADAGISTIANKGQQQPIAIAPQPETAPSSSQQMSWLQSIWAAVRETFAAMAAAVHHLIG